MSFSFSQLSNNRNVERLWAYFIVQDHAPTTSVHGFCLGCSALFGQCRRNCEYKYRRFNLFREDSLPMAFSQSVQHCLMLEIQLYVFRKKRFWQIEKNVYGRYNNHFEWCKSRLTVTKVAQRPSKRGNCCP
jgi:hypothetical protein